MEEIFSISTIPTLPNKTIHTPTNIIIQQSSMNLNRAFVLIFASIGAVAGFTPNCRSAFSASVASAYAPSVRVASTVFSEAESSETVEAVASEVPAFETSIYVGNISFGKFASQYYRILLRGFNI